MDNVTVNLSLVGLIISAVMMLIAITNMNRDKRNRDDTRYRDSIEMSVKLDNISSGMTQIRGDLQRSLEMQNENEKRIIKLEQSVANLIRRLNALEGKEK